MIFQALRIPALMLAFGIISISYAQHEHKIVIEKKEAIRHYPPFLTQKYFPQEDLNQLLISPKNLILIGEKVYDIIKEGKPVLNTSYKPISVLPSELKNQSYPSMLLDDWKGPIGYRYTISLKNRKGVKSVGLIFAILWTYNGQFEGKGRYISGLQIIPEKVWAKWGNKLSVNAVVDDVFIYGKINNPVVAVRLRLNYRISKMMKQSEENLIFVVDGNGTIKKF